MEEKYYIGFDIGGTKCAQMLGKYIVDGVCVPKIEIREEFPTAGKTPDEVLERFSAFIVKELEKHPIDGIGISCGGPLDSENGIIMRPPSLPLWDDIKIVEYFENKFGIKTYLQNDANACAVAEWKFGAGRGTDNMIFLTFGTGFGAGLILGGRLYGGTSDNAGEIGHIRLTDSGPEGYRKNGSCEGYCSGSGMVRLAKILGNKKSLEAAYNEYVKAVGGEDNVSAKTLAEEARKGNKFALAVYKKSGEMLGRTLSIIADFINPEKIVIGGVFMRSSDLLLPECKKVMEKECLPFTLSALEILPAGLGEKIGDYAALSVAKGDF